jgi:uncharacterized protein YeaO (DUF488 family)
MIRIKRAYETPARGDGRRILVERLWPRGVKKEALAADAWMKDVAPSTELRQWFGHRPDRWDEFRRRYREELDANPDAWAPLLEADKQGTVTLLYSAHDTLHSGALALRDYLVEHAAGRKVSASSKARSATQASKRKPPSRPKRSSHERGASSSSTARRGRVASTRAPGASKVSTT